MNRFTLTSSEACGQRIACTMASDADTKAYDDDLMEVWKVVAEEEADTANWSSFGSFGTFMCAELV